MSNFSLLQLGVSDLVTTDQAGKLVMLRPDGGAAQHASAAHQPMGIPRLGHVSA